jgi:hypothetical protein
VGNICLHSLKQNCEQYGGLYFVCLRHPDEFVVFFDAWLSLSLPFPDLGNLPVLKAMNLPTFTISLMKKSGKAVKWSSVLVAIHTLPSTKLNKS